MLQEKIDYGFTSKKKNSNEKAKKRNMVLRKAKLMFCCYGSVLGMYYSQEIESYIFFTIFFVLTFITLYSVMFDR